MRGTARVTISGVVQGVGYRYFCCRRADQFGIGGWVKNQPDGSVQVLAQGDTESLEQFIIELRKGPSGALVHEVKVQFEETTTMFDTFEVRRN